MTFTIHTPNAPGLPTLEIAVEKANGHVGQIEDAPIAWNEIPRSLLREKEGPCVECGCDTDNTDDREFICEYCLEDARAQQRSDERYNDPRHGMKEAA